ncbi:SUKH-3 domain-containing protein [Streptomyces violascens]|uniref:SUKH-3 domain-containing protein n=1 Tax=Streptomyces violascens TaxID=67381 RepID=UPI00366393BB
MSPELERVLRDAGWVPGRRVDTSVWRERLEADGFRLHEVAESFLGEFGGLVFGHGGPGVTRAREPFEFDPELLVGESDRFTGWGAELSRTFAPVGELDLGRGGFLGLDEFGELYVIEARVATFGRLPQALENLALGFMPVTVVD